MRKVRLATWVAAAATVAASAIPALGFTSPGTIAIASPVYRQAVADTTWVQWTWRSGSEVRSSRSVDVLASRNGTTWTAITRGVPIRTGRVAWNTTRFADGVYYVRINVNGTSVRATRAGIYLDNTNPSIRITSPKEGDVIVDDEHVATFAVVAGTATVSATTADALSGVSSVKWFLDDAQIADGSRDTFDFGSEPGRHTLTALATDRAGNTAMDSISVMALPGPSTILNGGPDPDPSGLPSVGPSDIPTLPDAPETPDAPDPSDIPEAPEAPDVPDAPEVPSPPASPPNDLPLPGLP